MRPHVPPTRWLSQPALLALLGLPLVAQPRDGEIEALREQICQLDQPLRVLKRKPEIRDEESSARAKAAPVVDAAPRGSR
jgi:hypothetical protein